MPQFKAVVFLPKCIKTPSYTWKYYGTYDHTIAVPDIEAGTFAIDASNRYLLVHRTDASGVSHYSLTSIN